MKLAQYMEGNSSMQSVLARELDETKQTLIDLETQAKQMSMVIQ